MAIGPLLAALCSFAQTVERKIDPTYLHRHVPELRAQPADISTASCEYTPIFGKGDPESVPAIMQGVRHFGKIAIAPQGSCTPVTYSDEEQLYVVMSGNGEVKVGSNSSALSAHDFVYLPASLSHAIKNTSDRPLEAFVMGFRVEPDTAPPAQLLIANFDEVKKQTVSSHPDSVVYQLMMGSVNSKRDRLAAAHRLTSLYIMEFRPNGTNFPHHHDSEEEIYYLMDGHGEMVAGGGENGIEGRRPAKAGDAYFFRQNCTVGFYNSADGIAHILAVRSVYPRPAYPQYAP